MSQNISINPTTGNPYVFKIGDAFALKNFDVTLVEGNRLKITSAINQNFTLLEADVAEVEIDGRIYQDPTSAQAALKALVFNPEIPMYLPQNLLSRLALNDASNVEVYSYQQVLGIMPKNEINQKFGNYYTKTEIQANYQPKGDYALVGDSFTKAESTQNLQDLKTAIVGTATSFFDQLGEIEAYVNTDKSISTALIQKNAEQDTEIANRYTKSEVNLKLENSGKNISNADLTNPAARAFTQGAAFTWNVNGMPYKITGLTDVSNNASFNLTTVIDANGNMGKADLRQLLLGSFQNLSAGQKTDIASLLNNATTTNNHFVAGVDNLMLEPNTTKTLLIYGTNLSVIASSTIMLKKGADTINATSWEIVNAQTIKAIFTLPSTLVLGDKYEINIYQGAVKNAGKVELVVANATAYLTPTTWAYVTASGTAPQTSVANGVNFNLKTEANLKVLANEALEVQSWFTEKLLLGSKNWQVNIQCASTEINAMNTKDFIGISSSDNALQNLVQFGMQFNNNEPWSSIGRQACFRLIGDTSWDGVAQPDTKNCTVFLSKIGSTIYSRVVSSTGRLMGSASATIDVSKDYRIWLTKGNSLTATQMQGSIQIIQY